ncbi:hypothetical protein POTOM_034854 [Populus tomentosa]|uniref:Uncharacterized protein n=1 Tax=Populus tomentosa TaxID=118781 RepID=A0A8X7Z3A4_POPTO|nr:hypothetical protein POTOM_034854 [Populus tomentosa]
MDVVNHRHHRDDGNQEFSKSLEGCEATDFKEKKSVMIKVLNSIGAHEIFSSEMWRATLTELVATACLLFTLTTSITSCLESTTAEPKFLIPFAIFVIAFFFLLTTVPLSGGHMSPVFTFIAALEGVITPVRALFYVSAQCVDSIVAYLVIKSVMDKNAEEKYSLGGCMIDGNGERISPTNAFILEFSCTFIVLFVGVTVAFDKRRCKEKKVSRQTSWAEALKDEGGKTKQITLREILGLEDLLSLTVWRASVAELLGTAVLVFALDTIVISTIQTGTNMPNLILSTLVAIIITILLLATFPISGGHINPIITFAAFLTGLISLSKTFIYILAQCVGAIFGALALKAVVNSEIEKTYSLGGCTLTIVAPGPHGPTVIGLDASQALWLEIICGFVFLFASVWMAFDHRQAQGIGRVSVFIIVGTVLGLLVFVSTTVTATKGYAGAGLNPARCLGPAIVRGGHLWNGHWVFWVGPAIACVAFAVYTKIIPRQLAHTVE